MPATVVHLPLYPVLFLLLLAGLVLANLWRGLPHPHRHDSDGEPDWSTPTLDAAATGTSPFHRWDPRFKIATLFFYCFLVVSLDHPASAGLAVLVSAIAVAASRVGWRRPLQRLAAMAGFLAMFLVVVPLTAPDHPGETVVVLDPYPWLVLHGHGGWLALLVILKAVAVALLMEPLLATAPLPVTLQALARLRLPNAVCQMILLAHRYVHVFAGEATRMYRSMRLRGFRPRTDLETLRAYGNFFGMLFVRSFDRTQRVYDAMRARGYTGVFPTFTTFAATGADWTKSCFWLLVGLALLAGDRFLVG